MIELLVGAIIIILFFTFIDIIGPLLILSLWGFVAFSIGSCAMEEARADVSAGIVQGKHFLNDRLNNTHTYIMNENENVGVAAYINSFEKFSFAAYVKRDLHLTSNLTFIGRLGITTGYSPINIYHGRRYDVVDSIMISDDLMVIVLPELRYKWDGLVYFNSMIMGDSLSVGIGVNF